MEYLHLSATPAAFYAHQPLSLIHIDAADDSLRVDLGGRRIIKKNVETAAEGCSG